MSTERHVLPVVFDVVAESLEKPFQDLFTAESDGVVRATPGGFVLSPQYAAKAEAIYNLPLRADDVWVVTFPKCGTTWTQEMVWLLVNDCNFEMAQLPLIMRSPFLEFPYLGAAMVNNPMLALAGGIEVVDQMTSPRTPKSHLPIHLLNPKLLDTCKVVYVARNPKDVIVSFYYHHKLIKNHNFAGTLEEFADYFMRDLVSYAPFFNHVLEAWKLRHHPNMHFMFFEDLKKDLRGSIAKVAAFLQKSPTDEQLTRLTEHLRFDNFKKNDAVNNEMPKQLGFMNKDGNFCRKGKTGDWKNHFSAEMNERIDRWIETNLAGSDLKFVTELDVQD